MSNSRVVQRSGNFRLKIDDEPVERSGKTIEFYRVERTDGPLLWLQAEEEPTAVGPAKTTWFSASKRSRFSLSRSVPILEKLSITPCGPLSVATRTSWTMP